MGQKLSCGTSDEHELFSAVQCGDLETVKALFEGNPSLVHHSTIYDRQSALHIAAANGQIEVRFLENYSFFFKNHFFFFGISFVESFMIFFYQVVSMLVDQSVNVDLFNRYKQV